LARSRRILTARLSFDRAITALIATPTLSSTRVSLVLTILNEARSLPAVLDGIAGQSRPPDEVVVCDGGSRDGSLELLRAERRFPVRVIEAPGANISRGRNLAIAAATHEVIACTDAGTRLDPHWLARLAEPFDRTETQVSAGFFEADFDSAFELAMSATVLPLKNEIEAASFLPSSRSVAFRKSAWTAVNGYPEWLDYCEDLVFDLALRKRFGAFTFVPNALVYFKPRGSLRSFFKQYYLYARGDGKAGLWLKRHLIRYATYLIAFPLFALLALLVSWPLNALALVALLGGFAVYAATPYRRLRTLARGCPASDKVRAALWIPVIRVWGDVAKMLGYPAGLAWRLSAPPH
jgi:glycosyltransferase involved in cell wall biosynthesis